METVAEAKPKDWSSKHDRHRWEVIIFSVTAFLYAYGFIDLSGVTILPFKLTSEAHRWLPIALWGLSFYFLLVFCARTATEFSEMTEVQRTIAMAAQSYGGAAQSLRNQINNLDGTTLRRRLDELLRNLANIDDVTSSIKIYEHHDAARIGSALNEVMSIYRRCTDDRDPLNPDEDVYVRNRRLFDSLATLSSELESAGLYGAFEEIPSGVLTPHEIQSWKGDFFAGLELALREQRDVIEAFEYFVGGGLSRGVKSLIDSLEQNRAEIRKVRMTLLVRRGVYSWDRIFFPVFVPMILSLVCIALSAPAAEDAARSLIWGP